MHYKTKDTIISMRDFIGLCAYVKRQNTRILNKIHVSEYFRKNN